MTFGPDRRVDVLGIAVIPGQYVTRQVVLGKIIIVIEVVGRLLAYDSGVVNLLETVQGYGVVVEAAYGIKREPHLDVETVCESCADGIGCIPEVGREEEFMVIIGIKSYTSILINDGSHPEEVLGKGRGFKGITCLDKKDRCDAGCKSRA
jgi:hypothetical protein